MRAWPTPFRHFGWERLMLDLLLLGLGLGVFAVMAAYAAACERI
jgi:hypothetical protein